GVNKVALSRAAAAEQNGQRVKIDRNVSEAARILNSDPFNHDVPPLAFWLRCYSSCRANVLITDCSSRTSMCGGQSGQVCRQHTIRSQPSGGWPCARKLRLSNSNSIRTRCHLPTPIWRFASQSG